MTPDKLFSANDPIIVDSMLLQDRVAAGFRRRAPQVIEEDDRDLRGYGDQCSPTLGLSAVAGAPMEEPNREPLQLYDMWRCCCDPGARRVDEWCPAGPPGLHAPLILVRLQDREASACETGRYALRGARAIASPRSSHTPGLPSCRPRAKPSWPRARHLDALFRSVPKTETDAPPFSTAATSLRRRRAGPPVAPRALEIV